jgi:putative tryptophan/tyrosine transport system substrate-binding protein
MRRREFITLLGGAAAAWPRAVRAQQGEPVRRVGVLMNSPADDAQGQGRFAAFLQGLQQLGWSEGRNVRIDVRWGAQGDSETNRQHADELVALAPEVILTTTAPPTAALQRATRTIPVVFAMVVDPVGAGIVASLSRPGGNITGFMQFEFSVAGNGWNC